MALSMPSPASAESRCSMVETLAPSFAIVVPRVVSPTLSARAGMSTGTSRSVRRNQMPWLAGAGRSTISTFLPVCRPTPVARIEFLSVLCFSISGSLPRRVRAPWIG